jgi:hypothetical protein
MKGEMPVPLIVALILAVIVIGLLGYWLITSLGKTGGTATNEMCRAKLMAACVGKGSDTSIDPYKYNECIGTDVAKTITKCGDVV